MMKKLFTFLVALVATLALTSCGNDDWHEDRIGGDHPNFNFNENYLSQDLSQDERDLVGIYRTNSDESRVYMGFYDDRTGFLNNGNDYSFNWYMLNGTIYIRYTDNTGEYYTKTGSGSTVYLNGTPFINVLKVALSESEGIMVGKYVSDDGGEEIVLTLESNRTGSYTMSGATYTFDWFEDLDKLFLIYSDGIDVLPITIDNDGRLCLKDIPFVTYNETQKKDDVLVGQWQGRQADAYYTEVIGSQIDIMDVTNWATVYEFAANGEGVQLDYDKTSPKTAFAYTPFTWVKNGSTISLSYISNDFGLTSASIDDYALSSTEFSGKMSYSGYNTYTFVYASTSGFDWSAYQTSEAKLTRGIGATNTSRLSMLRTQGKKSISCGTRVK